MDHSRKKKPAPHYEKLKCVGEGTFAMTYRGLDHRKGIFVAIKALKHSREDLIKKEMDVVNLLKELGHHDNIIDFLDEFKSPSTGFINFVFEYAHGGDVYARLKQLGTFSERDVMDIIKGTLEGLEFMHSKCIIHRDIKPANILLASRRPFVVAKTDFFGSDMNSDSTLQKDMPPLRPKIADFGLAEQLDSHDDVEYGRIGSFPYCPPEAFLLDRVGREGDMFAVGAMMYELLFRQQPFDFEELTDNQVKNEICFFVLKLGYGDHTAQEEARPLYKTVSSSARCLMAGLLRKDRKDRPSAKKALEYDWFKVAPSEKTLDASSLNIENRRKVVRLCDIRYEALKHKRRAERTQKKLELRKRQEPRSGNGDRHSHPSSAQDRESGHDKVDQGEVPKRIRLHRSDSWSWPADDPIYLPYYISTSGLGKSGTSSQAPATITSNHSKGEPGDSRSGSHALPAIIVTVAPQSSDSGKSGSKASATSARTASLKLRTRKERKGSRQKELSLRRETKSSRNTSPNAGAISAQTRKKQEGK